MSTAAFARGPRGMAAAWETLDQIQWGTIDPATGRVTATRDAPGDAKGRKHPAVAINAAGQAFLAWAEGTGWNKGGSVAWHFFDASGRAIDGAAGRAEGLPAWGTPAAFAAGGEFVIVY
jgi:hypothetical protein